MKDVRADIQYLVKEFSPRQYLKIKMLLVIKGSSMIFSTLAVGYFIITVSSRDYENQIGIACVHNET